MLGKGLAALYFLSKEIEILDLDPPINAISHYGACHFRYNLALILGEIFYDNDAHQLASLNLDYNQSKLGN